MIHKKLVLLVGGVSIVVYALFPKSPPLLEGTELSEIPLTTQSLSTEISSTCLNNTDFPTVLLADKETLAFIAPKESYTMLAFCSPHAPGCMDMSTKKNLGFEQRDLQETCHFSALIPYSQWTSWLKTTITKQPFFARKSAGVDGSDRQKIQAALSLSADTLPLFLLIDDCGKVVAQTTSVSQIENTFGSYCGKLVHHACGNGILEDEEVCDDGNLEEDDACTALCKPTACGDEVINTPNSDGMREQCDDGNTKDNDGCSATCLLEKEHIRYCDADDDSFYSYASVAINTQVFPHIKVQKAIGEDIFAYCNTDQGCRYVSCRHEPGDDCNDANNEEYTIGSFCSLGTTHGTFNEECICAPALEFTTQSIEKKLPDQAQGRCGSPDGTFINYPGSSQGGDTTASLRYQCSINNCSYCTDQSCFPNGGVCYYFCNQGGEEDYTRSCGQGLGTDITITNSCLSNQSCGYIK